ncbi:hypothetical protein C7D73_31010, partial [Klebsiella pneumoniae]
MWFHKHQQKQMGDAGMNELAGSTLAVALLLLIVPIMWFHKHQQKQMGDAGMNELAGSTLAVA